MEWGHPLVGPGRVQGLANGLDRIHRAARNLLGPLSPTTPSPPAPTSQPSPNASPSHRPGPGPHKLVCSCSHLSSNSITVKFPKLGFRQQVDSLFTAVILKKRNFDTLLNDSTFKNKSKLSEALMDV